MNYLSIILIIISRGSIFIASQYLNIYYNWFCFTYRFLKTKQDIAFIPQIIKSNNIFENNFKLTEEGKNRII